MCRMTTKSQSPPTFTTNNLLIGDYLVPKRGRFGKAGHVKTSSGRIKDYTVQPCVVRNAYRGDQDFTICLDDGVKVTLPVSVLQADWRRA